MLGTASAGESSKLSKFAGTALGIAALNYTGPYGALVSGLISTFNGGEVDPGQAVLNTQVEYQDNYKNTLPDDPYRQQHSATDVFSETDFSNSLSPTINASLIHSTPSGEMELLDNGATLRGPVGGYAGDRVGIVFAPENSAYVYVIAVDGTGWTQTLYPDPALGHDNPVPAGTEILLPGEALYGLDNVPGVETIYILSSNQPRRELEAKLQPFLGKERPPAASNSSYRSVDRPIIISRGLTGVRPGNYANSAATKPAAMQSGLPLNTFVAADGENEIALTLWFNHK
jgi:hypothetical protein